MRNSKVKETVYISMFTLVALGLSYLESLIPPLTAVPGIKIGLANIAVIFTLYKFNFKSASTVSLMRVFISFLLFGSVLSLAYSFAGALVSIIVMAIMKRSEKFSTVGVSVAGAISHNAAQIITAAVILGTSEIIFYLPVLVISAVISGIFIGVAGAVLVSKVKME